MRGTVAPWAFQASEWSAVAPGDGLVAADPDAGGEEQHHGVACWAEKES